VTRRGLPITDPGELHAALESLDERERWVLKLRYGLGGGHQHNLREIGQLLGVSRERVRQLEGRAIERLETQNLPRATDSTATGQPARRPTAPSARGSRHGPVRHWTLMLLWLCPAHVYALRKRLRELGMPEVTYRFVEGLEDEGLVSSTWAPGSGVGPGRRVYNLTSKGIEQLQADAETLERMAHTLTVFFGQRESWAGA